MTFTSPPASPSTPSRKRRSQRLSSLETSYQINSSSIYGSGTTNGTIATRRSSRTSQTSYQPPSPGTPRPISSRSSRRPSVQYRKSSRNSTSSIISIETPQFSGLGNLADELEQAWDQDETRNSSFLEGLREGDMIAIPPAHEALSPYGTNYMHDIDYNVGFRSPLEPAEPLQLVNSHVRSQSVDRPVNQHQRADSAYDGSDYGPESDPDEEHDSLPPMLKKRIRDIESITRMSANPEDSLSEGGGVITRTIQGLRDLGPQSNIEYGVTRLVTAYTSMTTHRTHKTRELFSQSHSLLYGGLIDLPEEVIDLLLDEIRNLSPTLSFIPKQNPLLSLQILASQTSELTYTLRSLTDHLQESKLAANAATRKLRSVKEMVEDMRHEEELVENSIMLIQAGDWDRRCKQRQAAQTCREIVDGFADKWGLERPLNHEIGLAR